MPLSGFHPAVTRWFGERFSAPTEPQRHAWPVIQAGRDALIAAPTGSGKTFAAFLAAIDSLVRQGLDGPLPDETQVVYVSPLKALSNDVQKNLAEPLAEIRRPLEQLRLPDVAIRTLVRTGDTPGAERQAMVRRPPHILVTTPESLYLLLTAERSRAMLRTARTVIVDEIHAVARDKRGSHLALSLERLDHRAEHITSHHGSLSKEKRLDAEQRLKERKLKALVATASLELGIDIGAVDLVCQIGSTRSIATLLQRVGRSGHHLEAIPKGRVFPLSRDELIECAALLRATRGGRLDRLIIPERPLDILAQQIVAMAACEEWAEQ